MPKQLEQLKQFDRPAGRNPGVTALKVALPILLMLGALAAAWTYYSPLRETVEALFASDTPQVQPEIVLDEDVTEPPGDADVTDPSPDSTVSDRPLLPTATERDQLRYREISLIRLALADYYKRNTAYPTTLTALVPEFLTRVPEDPQGIHPYDYRLSANGYSLEFVLEGDIANLGAGRHALTPAGYDPDPLPLPAEPVPPEAGTSETGSEETTNQDAPASTANASTVPIQEATVPDPGLDTDSDGLPDDQERQLGIDPLQADTDNDGLTDGEEVNLIGTNPLLADSDGDGFADLAELNSGFDPTATDKDLADTDSDGLWDLIEITRGLNPNDPDMDSDGLADGDELNIYGTDPRQPDTDGDGFTDGAEVADNYNPTGDGPVSGDQATAWRASQDQYGLHKPTLTTLNP